MFAYLLGQKLSLSADLASLLRLNQEIYNILTSLIATPSLSSTFGIKLSKLVEDYKKLIVLRRRIKKCSMKNLITPLVRDLNS